MAQAAASSASPSSSSSGMSGTGRTATTPTANSKDDEPATDTDGYTKKATLIALVSLGVTLLITGATSRRLLQKPPSAAAATTTAANTGVGASMPVLGPTAVSSMVRTGNAVRTPPLRQPSIAPSRRASSQLRALFASADPTAQVKTTDKLDFRANQHTGFAFAQQIPVLARSTPSAAPAASSAPAAAAAAAAQDDAAQSADPTMDAMLDAVKAFGIATALLLGTIGFGAFLIARRVGATDVGLCPFFSRSPARPMLLQRASESADISIYARSPQFDSFFHSLRHEIMHPIAQKLEPTLPDWLKQRQRDPDEIANDEREEHEVTSALRQEWREFVQEATDEQRRKDGKDLTVKAS